ncbi:unnamed protein product [Paramecium octaurelia]|uniref:Uncharacterized protein n=1 Tax=Paramecium octaurelia TaxID=43137 RepID=A0A8S1V0B2_PAROT|nr:unnamed protein product [Paramecium octaurelia]
MKLMNGLEHSNLVYKHITIEQFTKIKSLNQKLFQQSIKNRAQFEQELQVNKNYLAWNKQRQDEISRKIDVLLDEQCLNQLSKIEKHLKLQEYLNKMLLVILQMLIHLISLRESNQCSSKVKTYRNLFNENEVKTFLNLAQTQQEEGLSRGATLAERVLTVLESLEANLQASLEALEVNEIIASWQLARWISFSEAEVANLMVEYEKSKFMLTVLATQIQAALAKQAKSKLILQESQDALDEALADSESKRADYAEAKAKIDEDNAILKQVIIIFKNQVETWPGR